MFCTLKQKNPSWTQNLFFANLTNNYMHWNFSLGTLRYRQRITRTLKHYGTLWTTKCISFHFKSSFPSHDYGVFICFLLCIYSFTLTVLMLNKFTYSHEHTCNRRDQEYDWKSRILCPHSKSRTVACKPPTYTQC